MASLKVTAVADRNPIDLTSRGVNTRSKRKMGTGMENGIAVAKRKAGSPAKESAAKRAAFGDITNKREKTITIKKVTVESKVLPAVKVAQQVKYEKTAITNGTKMARTKTASAAVFGNENGVTLKDYLNPAFYLQKKPSTASTVLPRLNEKTTCAEATKKTQRNVTNKNAGRASEEFSEASLYVSALGDTSTDSKLTNSAGSKIGNEDKECGVVSELNRIDKLTISERDEEQAKLPEGVVDFDKENWNDPFQASNYAMDIFNYLKSRESKFVIKDYMDLQKEINGYMRALLVDWMVEVQEGFELHHETLHLGVKLVDLYLSRKSVVKEELQLLGAVCLFISSKFDERLPPLLDDFLYICDGAYTQKQLLRKEIEVLKVIDFDLGIPISYRFLRRYARCTRISMPTLTLARYILELCLMEYAVIPLSDSKMAAASLYLAIMMKNVGTWTDTHVYYTGYKLKDILPVAKVLNMCLHKKPKATLSTIRKKYSHKVFFSVAQVPLIDNALL